MFLIISLNDQNTFSKEVNDQNTLIKLPKANFFIK